MNSKDKKILMELFGKLTLVLKIATIVYVVIGFLIFNFFWQQCMDVIKDLREKIEVTTNQHFEELNMPVESGNVFTNFDNVEFTILDRQQQDNLCIILLECSTNNVNFENLNEPVLNKKEAVVTLNVQGIPKGYLEDEYIYNSFIKEGIQSSQKHMLDLINLHTGYDSQSKAGYITSEEMQNPAMPGIKAPIAAVYLNTPRLFQIVVNTDELDGFVINSMYHYSTKLDNSMTYFDLKK